MVSKFFFGKFSFTFVLWALYYPFRLGKSHVFIYFNNYQGFKHCSKYIGLLTKRHLTTTELQVVISSIGLLSYSTYVLIVCALVLISLEELLAFSF